MAKKTVEQELQEATGVKPKAKEKRQDYLKRLHGAASEIDDDGWKGLSTPAQKWCNEATKAFDADDDIPDFEGAGEAEEAAPKKGAAAKAKPAADEDDDAGNDAEEADAEQEDEVKTSKKPAAKKAAAKPAAKEEKAPAKKPAAAPAKAKGKKSSGGVQAVLNHVLKNPNDGVEDIVKALKGQGITVTNSTVSSARGFFKLVVRFLQDKKLTTKVIFKD